MGTSCELLINIIPEHATHCEAFAVLLVGLAIPEGAVAEGAFASVEAGSSAADTEHSGSSAADTAGEHLHILVLNVS
jgi:hypothetical protein